MSNRGFIVFIHHQLGDGLVYTAAHTQVPFNIIELFRIALEFQLAHLPFLP